MRRLLAMAAALAFSAQAPPPPADTILVNGHVITVDAQFSIAQAIAITGGRFTAVGADAATRKLAGPSTTTIDLHGQTVIPGLADGHLHDAGGGPGVDLSRARSIADVLAAVRVRVRASRPATGTKRSSPSIACRIATISIRSRPAILSCWSAAATSTS